MKEEAFAEVLEQTAAFRTVLERLRVAVGADAGTSIVMVVERAARICEVNRHDGGKSIPFIVREEEEKAALGVAIHKLRESLGLAGITPDVATIQLAVERLRAATAPSPWRGLMEEADEVVAAKGKDYTKGSVDRLANFRTAGSDAGITALQAWLVFYNKHHAAICSYIKSGGQSESEPIKGRFVDALNYLRLGWLLVLDAKEQAEKCKACDGTRLINGNACGACRGTGSSS